MEAGVFFSFLCLFIFSCVPPKKGVIVPGRAFHKLLGNFLASSGISSNVLLSEQFLSFSSNSEISGPPLVLKFVFLKKEPDPPPWGRSWAKHACSRAARSAVFKRKFKMADRSIKGRGWKKRVFFKNLLSKVRHKKQLFEKLRETFWEISSNLWKALVPGVLSGDRGNWG